MHEGEEGCQSYFAATNFCHLVRDRDSEFLIVVQALIPMASGARCNFFLNVILIRGTARMVCERCASSPEDGMWGFDFIILLGCVEIIVGYCNFRIRVLG